MRHIPHRLYQRLSGATARGRLKDTDSAATARKVRILFYSATGVLGGAAIGGRYFGGLGFLIGAVLGGAAVYGFVQLVSGAAGSVMGHIYNPSGRSTPGAREYSEPQALAQRGLFQEAIDCYETYVVEFPEDPEPCIRIARIYRDHLRRYDEAVRWFRRARQAKGIDRGHEVLVTREIIELYTGKLNEPRGAIPELARLAERFAGSREGDLARAELERLRDASRASSS